ncbi:MAG: phosphatidylglycerophosphatase A [Candidatus Binatia bacterium]|nr:phosphatidylglycerophosphatase A [Candidatus Binatia bacterium]MDG2009955.1 phosphatidylglycerophosphatase A [Candidatus Binatia bacterium]
MAKRAQMHDSFCPGRFDGEPGCGPLAACAVGQRRVAARIDEGVLWLARGLGLGLVPRAPGTAGSLLGIPLFFLVHRQGWPVAVECAIVAAFVLLACAIAGRAEKILGTHDSGQIVIDEIAGMWVALLGHPVGWESILVVFVIFRILDIWKPGPIRWLDRRVPGGAGVVVDDVASGAIASILAWGIGF